MSEPSLRVMRDLVSASCEALKETWTPINRPDLATCSLADWRAHQSLLERLEDLGFARHSQPGCLWLAAVFAPFESLLDNPLPRGAPTVNADLTLRWHRSPVLRFGPMSRVPTLGHSGSQSELLMKTVLMGTSCHRALDSLLEHADRLGRRLASLSKSRWPLPNGAREFVLSITPAVDRWFGFCVLKSLMRRTTESLSARAQVVIDGYRSPLPLTLDDLLQGAPLNAVRKARESEVRALGHPASPPFAGGTRWTARVECDRVFEDVLITAVTELEQGLPPHGLPPDAIDRSMAADRRRWVL